MCTSNSKWKNMNKNCRLFLVYISITLSLKKKIARVDNTYIIQKYSFLLLHEGQTSW